VKKKKKKKTTFDLDAALADEQPENGAIPDNNADSGAADNIDLDNDLDLENFGKKKKKKKKTGFNLEDLDAALPADSTNLEEVAVPDDENAAMDDNLDLGAKKKKKKKADISELLKDNKENEEETNGKIWQLLNLHVIKNL